MPKPATAIEPSSPAFEEAMKRLEEIVAEMESGNLPLESLISRHEEGVRLVAICNDRLDSAKKRIEIVEERGDRVTTTPFNEAESGGTSGKRVSAKAAKAQDPEEQTNDDSSLF